MDFPNVTFDSPADYRAFILSHEDAVKTEKAAWMDASKAGKPVIPYCMSAPTEEPDRESVVYFEFVDADLNIYVDFFNRDTCEWIESYRFRDPGFSWTISVDNYSYGNPLGIEY